MSTIGVKIKTLRKKNGMTQEELAKKLNVIQQQIQRWESGGRNPSLKTLTKLSKIFNVSLDTLILDGKEIKNLKIKDENVLEKIKKLELLNEYDKQAVITLIDSLADRQKQ